MKPALVAVVDLVLVLVFAAIGRASHGEDVSPLGLATTAWPFAAGWLLGWVVVLLVRTARTRPLGLAAGVLVWVPTVVVGMLLRAVSGAGCRPRSSSWPRSCWPCSCWAGGGSRRSYGGRGVGLAPPWGCDLTHRFATLT